MTPTVVYCRGCNREAKVFQETDDSYIERKDARTNYHPKRDCDIVNYFNGTTANIKPEVSRRDLD